MDKVDASAQLLIVRHVLIILKLLAILMVVQMVFILLIQKLYVSHVFKDVLIVIPPPQKINNVILALVVI